MGQWDWLVLELHSFNNSVRTVSKRRRPAILAFTLASLCKVISCTSIQGVSLRLSKLEISSKVNPRSWERLMNFIRFNVAKG